MPSSHLEDSCFFLVMQCFTTAVNSVIVLGTSHSDSVADVVILVLYSGFIGMLRAREIR